MDQDEIDLLAASLRELFARPGTDVGAELAALGWDDVVAADVGLATTLLFTEHGRALATTALLDRVVLTALAPDLPDGADAVCYPTPANGWTPSAPDAVSGLLLAAPPPDALIAVPVSTPDGPMLTKVSAADLVADPVRGVDRSLRWFAVRGAPAGALQPAPTWPDAIADAHRALAAELVGVAERALALAVQHTSSRRQFGTPIAAFQAVRHRLADAEVALAAARALVGVAFADGGPLAAAAAKAQAGRAHDLVSATAIQVCGAIGATREHALHRYVARGFALDALLGTSAALVADLGRVVVDSRDVPRLVEV